MFVLLCLRAAACFDVGAVHCMLMVLLLAVLVCCLLLLLVAVRCDCLLFVVSC